MQYEVVKELIVQTDATTFVHHSKIGASITLPAEVAAPHVAAGQLAALPVAMPGATGTFLDGLIGQHAPAAVTELLGGHEPADLGQWSAGVDADDDATDQAEPDTTDDDTHADSGA